jgi:hypothetical protein
MEHPQARSLSSQNGCHASLSITEVIGLVREKRNRAAAASLAAASLVALGVFLVGNRERKSLAEWREDLEDWYEKVQDRRKTSVLLARSKDATLVGVAEYLDGVSIGFVFTNRLGSFTVFLPHPFGREDWDGEKMRWTVTHQDIFVGPQEAGTNGIKVKVGSRLEHKLVLLAESAKRNAEHTEHRDYFDRFSKVLHSRQFDWTDLRQ